MGRWGMSSTTEGPAAHEGGAIRAEHVDDLFRDKFTSLRRRVTLDLVIVAVSMTSGPLRHWRVIERTSSFGRVGCNTQE